LSDNYTIKVESLCKSYGSHRALEALSFSASAGEIIGILGRNGAGKSTTFRLLTTYIKPSAGSATINGSDLIKQTDRVRRSIGYLPENFALYPELTVREYLLFIARMRGFSRSKAREYVGSSLELCCLLDYQNVLCSLLSKGYRQRVGLAQAILHRPPVVILDEPSNGLDPEQVTEVRAVIESLAAEGITILLSTHILQEVQILCKRVLVLDSGKLVLDSGVVNPDNSFGDVERLFRQAIIKEQSGVQPERSVL